MSPRIPERKPISDVFTGLIVHVAGHDVLMLALTDADDVDASITHEGTFFVRYGLIYLQEAHSMVPELIALDYGDMLAGEEAWDFILNRSNLYPRADVVGYRDDGTDDMVVLKKLDIMHPVEVLVYADDASRTPLAKVTGLIAADTSHLPERLLRHLPQYDTLAAFLQAQNKRKQKPKRSEDADGLSSDDDTTSD